MVLLKPYTCAHVERNRKPPDTVAQHLRRASLARPNTADPLKMSTTTKARASGPFRFRRSFGRVAQLVRAVTL